MGRMSRPHDTRRSSAPPPSAPAPRAATAPTLRLSGDLEAALEAGHPWIYRDHLPRDVRFEAGEGSGVRLKPNLPVLGPRLGKRLPTIGAALAEGRYELDGNDVVVEGERLSGDDVLRERTAVNDG